MGGIFIPLLPTTPFLLAAAACYARGSPRLYRWLLNNKIFGVYIKDWREGRGIPLKSKVVAIILLYLSVGYSVIFFIKFPLAKVILALMAIGVSAFIISRPTK